MEVASNYNSVLSSLFSYINSKSYSICIKSQPSFKSSCLDSLLDTYDCFYCPYDVPMEFLDFVGLKYVFGFLTSTLFDFSSQGLDSCCLIDLLDFNGDLSRSIFWQDWVSSRIPSSRLHTLSSLSQLDEFFPVNSPILSQGFFIFISSATLLFIVLFRILPHLLLETLFFHYILSCYLVLVFVSTIPGVTISKVPQMLVTDIYILITLYYFHRAFSSITLPVYIPDYRQLFDLLKNLRKYVFVSSFAVEHIPLESMPVLMCPYPNNFFHFLTDFLVPSFYFYPDVNRCLSFSHINSFYSQLSSLCFEKLLPLPSRSLPIYCSNITIPFLISKWCPDAYSRFRAHLFSSYPPAPTSSNEKKIFSPGSVIDDLLITSKSLSNF